MITVLSSYSRYVFPFVDITLFIIITVLKISNSAPNLTC